MKDFSNKKNQLQYNNFCIVLSLLKLIKVQLNYTLLMLRPVSMLRNIIERIITFKEKAIPRITKNISQ
jgi:hypothetical protein